MLEGAILKSSVELITEIIENKKKPKLEIKKYFKKNRFAGSKDKRLIQEIVFKYLKNYFSLEKICRENQIKLNFRNTLLVYYFSENRKKNLKDIYEGKYSIKPEIEDEKIYKIAINLTHKIIPSLPNWLEKKIGKNINLKASYKSVLLEPRFDLRVNNLNSRDDVIKLLSKNNIPSVESKFSQLGITILKRIEEKKINKIKSGAFEIQDEGSQIVTILSGAKSGEKVLDYCAGKGTKTIALYEQMQGIGSLYAYDENQQRLTYLSRRLERLKLNKKIFLFDHDDKFKNYFDLVLLDVPCTGSGVWRRRPESIIKINKADLKEYVRTQKEILNKASKYCKKNGIMSYITCSLFEDENEGQVKSFLKENKGFEILDINLMLKEKFNKNIIKNTNSWLTLNLSEINSDGFFICLLKKKYE
jgi:16S rRNA (cytosine967-C5)-methyltransferase